MKFISTLKDTFGLDQFIGKTLTLYKDAQIIDSVGNKLYIIKKGSSLPPIYSWIGGKNGQPIKAMFWNGQTDFKIKSNKPTFWKLDKNAISAKQIVTQGGKSDEQKYKEEQAKDETFTDKIFKEGKKFAYIALGIGAGLFVVKTVISESRK